MHCKKIRNLEDHFICICFSQHAAQCSSGLKHKRIENSFCKRYFQPPGGPNTTKNNITENLKYVTWAHKGSHTAWEYLNCTCGEATKVLLHNNVLQACVPKGLQVCIASYVPEE